MNVAKEIYVFLLQHDFDRDDVVIGAFYQPRLVYSNVNVLFSLPKDEIRSAFVEIIVHAIIKSESLFELLEKNLNELLSLKSEYIMPLIKENCIIKKMLSKKTNKRTVFGPF